MNNWSSFGIISSHPSQKVDPKIQKRIRRLIGFLCLEFVFRSSILCLLYSHVSLSSALFLSPLFFGLAHFHHMLEHFKRNQHEQHYRMSPTTILLSHLFQFSYTYIFGVYSSFLFIRTGHFIPSFLVHTLCNGLGVPDVINLIDVQDGQWKQNLLLVLCYLVGLWLFASNLFVLTQSTFYYSKPSSIVFYRHWSSYLWCAMCSRESNLINVSETIQLCFAWYRHLSLSLCLVMSDALPSPSVFPRVAF